MENDFRMDLDRSGPILTVYVEGEPDLGSGAIHETVIEAIDANVERVTIDASRLTFCGSTGIRSLTAISDEARTVRAEFTIYKAPDALRRVIEVCCLEEVLPTRC